MPRFNYRARDKDGKLLQGRVEHVDRDEAVTTLQTRGLIVLSVTAEKGKKDLEKAARKARKFKRSLKLDDLIIFGRQTATLLDAGVTLLRALSIISRQISSRPLYEAVEKMRIDVEEGHSLHEALAHYPKIFSPLWVNLIQTGEASGQLALTFQQLAAYLETNNAIIRKIKGAMIYPAILLLVCIAAILIFSLKVIPMFGEIYKGFNITLPRLTLAVLDFSDFIRRYFILFMAGLIGFGFLCKRFISTSVGRPLYDAAILRVPLVGPIISGMVIERFAHGLSTLIKSGIPILYGLDIIGKVVGNKSFERALESVREEVRVGKAMTEQLEATGLFPVMVTQMIGVGEETGKLSEMLERISAYYQERLNAAIDKLTAAFEPLLLIFMGMTVGVLVIAMYLPIFKMASGISASH